MQIEECNQSSYVMESWQGISKRKWDRVRTMGIGSTEYMKQHSLRRRDVFGIQTWASYKDQCAELSLLERVRLFEGIA